MAGGCMDAAAPNALRLLACAIQAAFEFLEIAEALDLEAELCDEFVNDHRGNPIVVIFLGPSSWCKKMLTP